MLDSEDLSSNLFLAFAGMLLAIGTLMVYSASMSTQGANVEQLYLSKHVIFLGVALLCGGIASQIPAHFWYRLSPILYLASVALLIAVLIPGLGHKVNGAQRWIRIGSISIQPSEIAKITLPLMVCRMRFFRTGESRETGLFPYFQLLAMIGLPLSLVLIEPDLGTTLFLLITSALALFFSRFPLRYFFMSAVALAPLALSAIALKPYQLARIRGFIQTWTSLEEAPYQVRQSLTTLGVGGLQGTGLGKGWQKLSFLPEANTDFIFAVIGEELGLIGTLGIIALWAGLYLSGLSLIRQSSQTGFASVAATTLLTQLVLQAALNVAVVAAMVPPKGISHPLISYGGSNLVTTVSALGLIVSLTKKRDTKASVAPEEQHHKEKNLEHEFSATSAA